MLQSRSVYILFVGLPVVAALMDVMSNFFGDVCLGRANPSYWTSALMIILNFQTYHQFLGSRSYTDGDYSIEVKSMCEVFFTSHEAVATEMEKMVEKLDDGSAKRSSSLGLLRLAQAPFTCTDSPVYSDGYCGIGLGMPHLDHSKIRPFLDEALGLSDGLVPWGEMGNFWDLASIRTDAEAFLLGRSVLRLGQDSGNFFLIQIHRRALGIELTEEEAETMQVFFTDFLQTTVLPAVPIVTNAKKMRQQRAVYLDMYVAAIEARILSGTVTTVNEEDVLLAANSFLDAMAFAGFPSLAGVSTAVVGVFLHNLGNANDVLDWNNPVDVGRAIMEAVRVYPPVLGIPYVEGNKRYESLAGYSGYDLGVFGADSHDFRVRFDTVDEYRDQIINFADRAFPVVGKPETSHVCPARSFAYNLLLGFLLELDIETWMELGDKPEVQPSGSGPSFWDYYEIQKVV